MDNFNQNNLNKKTQNEELIGDIVECGLDMATDGLGNFATHNTLHDVDIDIEPAEPLDLDIDDVGDGGILESLLDNLDDIPIIGIIIGLIAVVGGIIFAIKKLKKK